MQNSLFKRLVMALLLIFSVLLYLFFVWSNHLATNIKLESEQKLHLNLASHLAADNPMLQDQLFAYENLSGLFHTLMMLGPNFEFYFVDPSGKILTYSADPGVVKRSTINMQPLLRIISDPQKLPLLGDNPRDLNGQAIFSVAPVKKEGQLQGYLYVVIGSQIAGQLTASIKDNQQLWLHFMLIVVILCFLAISMLLIFYWVTRPVQALAKAVLQVENEGWESKALLPWQNKSENEVLQLGNSFNQLVKALKQQMQQLKNFENQRSEVLAGLSHDLRTPLSSLQGYIEILINKKDYLSPEQQIDYMNILDRNSTQLRHLTDQLFELAYLEGGEVAINIESILVAELMYDIKNKLQLTATRVKVDLVIECSDDSLMVDSDIGKVERVLTNLVDNAIRHTPTGGCVTIISEIEQGKIRLAVRDTGVGICETEIPCLFEARFKGQSTEYHPNQNKIRAGLGLAICKKLLNLLDSDIGVESKPQQGANFSFLLPLSNTY